MGEAAWYSEQTNISFVWKDFRDFTLRRKVVHTSVCPSGPEESGAETYVEGSWREWCISNMIYSRDTPFWSETLDVRTVLAQEIPNEQYFITTAFITVFLAACILQKYKGNICKRSVNISDLLSHFSCIIPTCMRAAAIADGNVVNGDVSLDAVANHTFQYNLHNTQTLIFWCFHLLHWMPGEKRSRESKRPMSNS